MAARKLYDSALYARNWLQKHLRQDAINAVVILTDFTVGYGNEGEFNPEPLKKIPDLNGGYYSKGNPETISRLMADLQVEF